MSNTRGQFELKLSENEISLLFLAIARASSRYDLHCNSQRHCWYRHIIVAQVFYMIENLRNDNMTILKMLQKQLQNYSAGDNTAAATAEWRRIKIETKERFRGDARIKKLMLGFAVFSKLSPKSHREFGTFVSRGISLSNNKRRANVLVHRRFKDPSTRNSFENHSTKNVTRSSTWAKLKKNHVGKVAGRKGGAG